MNFVPSRDARDFHGRLGRFYPDHAARFAYAEYASDHLLGAVWDVSGRARWGGLAPISAKALPEDARGFLGSSR